MTFIEIAKKRYSCRNYQAKPVEKEELVKVLEAGRIAPSATNAQPWEFIVVQEENLLDEIKSCYQKDWILSAPAIIVICGNHRLSWKREDGKDHCDIDIAIATDHLTMAATEYGLATCWVCKFDAPKCKKLLNLPEEMEPMVLLPIGYPVDSKDINRHDRARKPLETLVKWR
ncbi:MAG: nitroreductase family protein [Bacteroidota bacterium]